MLTDRSGHAPEVSVIVPVRDQRDALAVTMAGFQAQICSESWELIVIDDGSEYPAEDLVAAHGPVGARTIRLPPSGRAVARNAGLDAACGSLCLFCDGDRAPGTGFVARHLSASRSSRPGVVIGGVREFYVSDLTAERDAYIAHAGDGFAAASRMARTPPYIRGVLSMFGPDGTTDYAVPWLAFLSGNISYPREIALRFDEAFDTWGLEHFELGLRMAEAGIAFKHAPDAINYHFAHPRPEGFYDNGLEASLRVFADRHPYDFVGLIYPFLDGKISLERFEAAVRRERNAPPVHRTTETYYTQRRRAARYATT